MTPIYPIYPKSTFVGCDIIVNLPSLGKRVGYFSVHLKQSIIPKNLNLKLNTKALRLEMQVPGKQHKNFNRLQKNNRTNFFRFYHFSTINCPGFLQQYCEQCPCFLPKLLHDRNTLLDVHHSQKISFEKCSRTSSSTSLPAN